MNTDINDLCKRYGWWCSRQLFDSKGPYSKGPLQRIQEEGLRINIRPNDPFKSYMHVPKQIQAPKETTLDEVPIEFIEVHEALPKLPNDYIRLFYVKYMILTYKGYKIKDKERAFALGISKRTLYNELNKMHILLVSKFDT